MLGVKLFVSQFSLQCTQIYCVAVLGWWGREWGCHTVQSVSQYFLTYRN